MGRFSVAPAPAGKECSKVFGDIRISVISDRIMRLEKGAFTDNATQMVVCRNFANPQFKIEQFGDKVFVVTNAVKFIVDLKSLKTGIEKDGQTEYPSVKKNLGGTARTLDGTFGYLGTWKTKREKTDHFCLGHFRKGIFATNGIVEIDDSKSVLLNEDGSVSLRKAGSVDKYFFAFGDDYIGGLKEFYGLCGSTPVLPKYALGNWWSRYHAYSDDEYLELMDNFEKRNIPLTVATIDMDWHIVKNVPKDVPRETFQSKGWTGYTFEKSLFKDYKAFLRNLKDRGLAVTMNLHPRDGVRYYEQQYEQMAKACGIDPATKEKVPFDLTDKKFLPAYFDILHHPYEEDGVDFWWIDWQQGTKSGMKGLDPLWLLNHYHTLDIDRNKKGMILSRYAGIGSHRYPLGFSGDTLVMWKSLELQPWFTAQASNAGYTWWSHDIGGHVMNHGNEEIYLRWLQYGVFSPINRLHSNVAGLSKEPWLYPHVEKTAEDYLRLRHSLLPYLYSANIRTAEEGIPLISPMYYYCRDKVLENKVYKNQYYFGEQMIVAAIDRPSRNGISEKKVYLPEGEWVNFFTGQKYQGKKEYLINCSLEEYPVFVKMGSVVPLLNTNEGNSQKFDNLFIKIYPGECIYTLYDEGGKIVFDMKKQNDGYHILLAREGMLETSNLTVSFEGLKVDEIYADGVKISVGGALNLGTGTKEIMLKTRD